MRYRGFLFLFVLTVFSFTGAAMAVNDSRFMEHVEREGVLQGNSFDGADKVHLLRTCFCPYIAYGEPFRSGELEYVRSLEFAESVYAVASGASRYSPEAIPPEWMATAYNWWTHVARNEVLQIHISRGTDTLRQPGREGEPGAESYRVSVVSPTGHVIDPETIGLTGMSCSPSLLFRASLEYRWRIGQPDAKPVYPHKVRMGTGRLADSIRAKIEMARTYAGRADAISARIANAERMGAGTCRPNELSRAKGELNRARHIATDIRYDVKDLEDSFATAEASAESMLALQKIASSRGLLCYSP